MFKKILFVFVAYLLFVAGCSQQLPEVSDSDSDSVSDSDSIGTVGDVETVNETTGGTITINHFIFEPAELAVAVGKTVTWIHNNNVSHTIISKDGLFESDVLENGDKFTFVFSEPGVYEYYCSIHPSMQGKITVE